ncbi:hypothetical protein EK904_006923, partial [Melospiza melodia maxima]
MLQQAAAVGAHVQPCPTAQAQELSSVPPSLFLKTAVVDIQTGRVNLVEFYLTLAMKILFPRPCLQSSGMK